MTSYDRKQGVYRTFCDVSSHFIINSFLDKSRGRVAQKEPRKKLQSPANQIQINITKNLKKSSFQQFSEEQNSKTFSDPMTSQNNQHLQIMCKKNKKLSFQKSIQNCESSNLLSVVRPEDENIEKLTRRSKTEDGTHHFFPNTIEDIDVPGAMNRSSDNYSFNIFKSQNSLRNGYVGPLPSKSCRQIISKN